MTTFMRRDAELERDSLRNVEPMYLSMYGPRQTSVVLVCTADYASCGLEHSLQLGGCHFRRLCEEALRLSTRDSRKECKSVAAKSVSSDRHERCS